MASITKRGDTYRIMISCGYDMLGKQIRKTTTFKPPENVTEGKGRKLAEAYAHEFEKKCQGITNLHENMRFHELVSWYFDKIAINTLKETTQIGKRNLIETYVVPYIGNLKLKDINTPRLDELWITLRGSGRLRQSYTLADTAMLPMGTCKPTARLAGLSAATIYTAQRGHQICGESARKIAEAHGKALKEMFTPVEGAKGLDATTVSDIRRAVSAVYNVAKKKEIVTKNPVTNSTPPKIEHKEKPFLDDSQCKRLLDILGEHSNVQLRVMLTTLMYSGMRTGELCALRWSDIDTETATITIRHTLSRIRGKYVLTTPKTRASKRYIKIPQEILDMLMEHKAWQDERRKGLGAYWTERDAVFTAHFGEWFNKTGLNNMFKLIINKNGFPDVHAHDLRHACASLLINMGVPTKLIAEHLGHADTRTTEQVYAHVFASTRSKASDAISLALSGKGAESNDNPRPN